MGDHGNNATLKLLVGLVALVPAKDYVTEFFFEHTQFRGPCPEHGCDLGMSGTCPSRDLDNEDECAEE